MIIDPHGLYMSEQSRLFLTGFKLRYAWRRWFLFRIFLPTRDKHHLTRFHRGTMDEIEPDTQSFIVKVWVEDHAEEAGHRVWRGHITHVSSNKRRYLNNLSVIEDFISLYLEEMGVQLGIRWRIKRWLNCLPTHPKA